MCLEFEMNSKAYLVLRNGYEYAEAEGQKANPEPTLHRTISVKAFEYDIHPSLKAANEFLCPQDGQSER